MTKTRRMTSSDVLSLRDQLKSMREILFANVVMAAEIPAPTGDEWRLTRFLSDRFTECGLDNIAKDEAGNVAGVLSGKNSTRNLLVAAHLDKIWSESEDHTVSVGVGEMTGRGIADNSLGIAVLASMPLILERLGIELESNLILLGTSRSFGRGDIRGMRFFLENTEREIESGLCLEGIDLGRVSHSSLGMGRGELTICTESPDGVICALADCVDVLEKISGTTSRDGSILIGAIEAGSGYNVPPRSGTLRFEIRSEDSTIVAEIESEVSREIQKVAKKNQLSVEVEMVAHRKPGKLPSSHSLVKSAKQSLGHLGVDVHDEPSISELAALLAHGVPALTLGITNGTDRHSASESIQLEPIFNGLAQIVSVLKFMDEEGPDFS